MNKLSNIELYAIFKKFMNRFAKESDYDWVVELVVSKLDIVLNVKEEFKGYKAEQ